MKMSAILLVLLTFATFVSADDKGYDTSMLPEGAIYEGTVKVVDGGKVTFSSGLEIKITKREGNKVVAEWCLTDNKARAKIEGTISGAKVSFKFTKELEGTFPKDVIGNAKASGTLKTGDDGTEIKNGTYVVPGQARTGSWEVKEKKD